MAGSVVVPDLDTMAMEKSLPSRRCCSWLKLRVLKVLPAIDFRIAAALAHVAVLTLQQLNGSPGAQIAAADAHHHENIRVGADALRGALNAQDLVGSLCHRQVQPAGEVTACSGALSEHLVGIEDFFFKTQQVGKACLTPDIGNINTDHNEGTSFLFLKSILTKKAAQCKGAGKTFPAV